MSYNPDIHHRRSIRLGNDDYSQAVGTRHAVPLQRPTHTTSHGTMNEPRYPSPPFHPSAQ